MASRTKIGIGLVAMLVLFPAVGWAAERLPNLLPNGDVENVFVNHIKVGEGRSTTIEAWDSGVPTFWRLGAGAALADESASTGKHCIVLQGGEQAAESTVFSDYWRVKDPAYPFGLPLRPMGSLALWCAGTLCCMSDMYVCVTYELYHTCYLLGWRHSL